MEIRCRVQRDADRGVARSEHGLGIVDRGRASRGMDGDNGQGSGP